LHEIVRTSFKSELIIPRTGVWNAVYDRAMALTVPVQEGAFANV
jgi:hypothetical protein